MPVHAVGKVRDLFAGVGIDEAHPAPTNERALADDHRAAATSLDAGLVFTNLVETDQVYGHRKDVAGFHAALRRIDAAVGRWLGLLGDDDLLVLTADHGCDPAAPHTDHTREHAPLLACFAGHDGRRHDGPLADVGASVLRWLSGARRAGAAGRAVRLGTAVGRGVGGGGRGRDVVRRRAAVRPRGEGVRVPPSVCGAARAMLLLTAGSPCV